MRLKEKSLRPSPFPSIAATHVNRSHAKCRHSLDHSRLDHVFAPLFSSRWPRQGRAKEVATRGPSKVPRHSISEGKGPSFTPAVLEVYRPSRRSPAPYIIVCVAQNIAANVSGARIDLQRYQAKDVPCMHSSHSHLVNDAGESDILRPLLC